ncbi:MAG: hypothetical protein K0R25_147 [Rickettsiaceae bacterium]|nr:hypothetical protein [Rickettsiaceae bacterium]
MKKEIKLGANKTGIQMSPIDSGELIEFAKINKPDVKGSKEDLAEARGFFVVESNMVGSVSLPGTIKGTAKTVAKKLAGTNIEILIDKLGERLAFERSGVRLYDALIAKVKVLEDVDSEILEVLVHFQKEEAEHFALVHKAIIMLGADPTAQTPCADVVGVSSLGIMQVMTDPRTNLAQCLNALLTAELTDNAGWELLIKLADETNQKEEIIKDFEKALKQEQEHLNVIKSLLEDEVFKNITDND